MGISYPVTTAVDLEPPFHSQDAYGSVLLRLAYNIPKFQNMARRRGAADRTKTVGDRPIKIPRASDAHAGG